MSWHNLSLSEIKERLSVDLERGLSLDEVKKRRERYGKNVLKEKRDLSLIKLALKQFNNALIYILVVAATISVLLGRSADALVISGAVFVNAVFGFWKELKTRKTLKALKKVLRVKAVVLRNGVKKEILKEGLVPGDIVIVKAGDKVPADCRLLEASNLQISEAVLTGEWLPVEKELGTVEEDRVLAERGNMIFAGSLCERGEAKAVVVETGESTEMGQIAKTAQEVEELKTPLSYKMDDFTKKIAIVLVVIAAIIFASGVLRGYSTFEMFESALAVSVGGVPEALPIVLTLALATGMSKILDRRGLVKNLGSVETLGSIEVICTDKTKTLTYGEMEVGEVKIVREGFYRAMALANEGFVENPDSPVEEWVTRGAPTDRALLEGAGKEGFIKHKMPEAKERIPFDSENKYTAVLVENEVLVAGAPETIFDLCGEDHSEDMEKMVSKGLRVIALARGEEMEIKDLEFLGLVGLQDPVREDAGEALELCQKAGIQVVIVTGDHKRTALGVAEKLGFEFSEENVLTGKELGEMSDEELSNVIERIQIFARTTPLQKIRIVEAWQKKDKIVAMTGDGVNDGPALVRADVGIALNSGTEVAKESADLVLLDDAFSIIVESIKRGRTVFDNLRKSISYALADSFTAVVLVGNAIIFGWPLPILPMQLFWNNIIEDTLPDLAFAFERTEEGIMERKPVSRKEPLLNTEMRFLVFVTGIIDELFSIFLFWVLWKRFGLELDYVRTVVFGSICLDTAFVVYAYKNLKKSIWQINPFSNPTLILSSVVVIISFAIAIYVPFFQNILGTVPLGGWEWVLLIAVALLNLTLIETTKRFFIND